MARRKRTPEMDEDEQRETQEAIDNAEEPTALEQALAVLLSEDPGDPDDCLEFVDPPEEEEERDACGRCGMNRWMHDAEHLAFLSSNANTFCTCGAPAGLHYRGGEVDGRFEQSPGVPFECEGFRDATAVDPPEQKSLWRWEMTMHDGRAVMQHDIVFAGFTLTLDETRPEHKELWDQIRIGNVMSFDLTGDVVRTGQHKPIKADGEIIGLVEQRTIHLYAMPIQFAGGDTAGLPLFDAAEDRREAELLYAPDDLCACGETFGEHLQVDPWTCTDTHPVLMGDGTTNWLPCPCPGFRLHRDYAEAFAGVADETAPDEHLDQESGDGEDEA